MLQRATRVRHLAAALLAGGLALAPRVGHAQDSTPPHPLTQQVTTRKTRISAYPYAYYTPETQVAVGVGGIVTFYTSHSAILRPSKVTASAYYTTTKQYKITLAPQLYLAGNRTVLIANFDYGYIVDKYWGIGNGTPDIPDPGYTAGMWSARVVMRFPTPFRALPAAKLGAIYDFLNYDIRSTGTNPNLTPATVGIEGGRSAGLGFSWALDTRDHVFVPARGVYHQIEGVYNGHWLGGDFGYDRYEVDLRQYFDLKAGRVLATQLYGTMVTGTVPFYELPALGGQRIMRGYYQGRYRDRLLVAGQVEVRTPLFGRFGAVGFAGLGDVAGSFGALQVADFKSSLGFGLRFAFNRAEKVNLRADMGFGRHTNGVYFGLEEAF